MPKKKPYRISIATIENDKADAVDAAVKDLELSKGHIAFCMNGKVNELFFVRVGATPMVMKAPITAPLVDGRRGGPDTVAIATGADQCVSIVKTATAKTPRQIGLAIRTHASPASSPEDAAGDQPKKEPVMKATKTRKPKAEKKAKAPKTPKAAKPQKDRKLSLLDHAAAVLKRHTNPLTVKEITAKILEAGIWKTGGKTPHATLYSAMIREIADATKPRFKKVDRGQFVSNE